MEVIRLCGMARVKPKHYYDPCFRQNFYFFIGWKYKALEIYLEKFYKVKLAGKEKDYAGKAFELFHSSGKHIVCVWVENKKHYSALAHECFHAVSYCYKAKDVKYDYDNDEPFAYLLGRLVEEAMK
jgi:hypothetical protein